MTWAFNLPWDSITIHARVANVDRLAIGAIVMAESGGDKLAIRIEPNYKWFCLPADWAAKRKVTVEAEMIGQAKSYGYMQVMGAVCREYGFAGQFSDLLSDLSLKYGCQHFAKFLKQYGQTTDAVAAYNAGSVRHLNKQYVNQGYVDRVMGYYETLHRMQR